MPKIQILPWINSDYQSTLYLHLKLHTTRPEYLPHASALLYRTESSLLSPSTLPGTAQLYETATRIHQKPRSTPKSAHQLYDLIKHDQVNHAIDGDVRNVTFIRYSMETGRCRTQTSAPFGPQIH